jgi:hydroxymethylbilane synthase
VKIDRSAAAPPVRTPLRIGSRGSKLSRWQASWFAARLGDVLPARTAEIVTIVTRGDVNQQPFLELSESGVFTADVERQLSAGKVDLAVHSLKDLPVSAPGALPIVAIPLRDDPADAVVSREGHTLVELPEGARVGTSSPRRSCLVRSVRPDLEVVPLRGNVDTRVRKLDGGAYDAIVLAVAGLDSVGLLARISERLDPRDHPPAPGQAALAVQVRERLREIDPELYDAVAALDDPEARSTSTAERSCLRALGGGCARPIGAHAWSDDDVVNLVAFVGSPDGSRIVRAEGSGGDVEKLGRDVAAELLERGAGELLA